MKLPEPAVPHSRLVTSKGVFGDLFTSDQMIEHGHDCFEAGRQSMLEQKPSEPIGWATPAQLNRGVFLLGPHRDKDVEGMVPLYAHPPFNPDWANYRQGVEDGKAEALGQSNDSAYQRGYLDGIARDCPDCKDYRAMYLKVRDELAALQQEQQTMKVKP